MRAAYLSTYTSGSALPQQRAGAGLRPQSPMNSNVRRYTSTSRNELPPTRVEFRPFRGPWVVCLYNSEYERHEARRAATSAAPSARTTLFNTRTDYTAATVLAIVCDSNQVFVMADSNRHEYTAVRMRIAAATRPHYRAQCTADGAPNSVHRHRVHHGSWRAFNRSTWPVSNCHSDSSLCVWNCHDHVTLAFEKAYQRLGNCRHCR